MIQKLYQGYCENVMLRIPNNFVDSIVTDVPYGLKFMNKKWDYKIPGVLAFQLMLRIAKPGAHLLCFGGTRTYHRIACNIEDAGWEIRDCIQWIYGSGFPKNMDVSKAIDKKFGAQREVIGQREDILKKQSADLKRGYRKISESFDKGAPERNNGFKNVSADITAPSTPEAKEWEGWGTALKPAYEPIILARKPTEGTIAENVLRYSTGGINIDECRIVVNRNNEREYDKEAKSGITGTASENISFTSYHARNDNWLNNGRWPANVILDEEAGEMLDEQSGASRFFYCAKASKAERNAGLGSLSSQNVNDGRKTSIDNPYQRGDTLRQNTHPTVKPLKLMEYLVKLITPKNGICIDPYCGSGTTLLACINNDFQFIGIENDITSFDIALRRVVHGCKIKT